MFPPMKEKDPMQEPTTLQPKLTEMITEFRRVLRRGFPLVHGRRNLEARTIHNIMRDA